MTGFYIHSWIVATRTLQIVLEQFGAAQVYGLDLDPLQIRQAQQRFASTFQNRVVLAVGSVDDLPYPDEWFDAVFAKRK